MLIAYFNRNNSADCGLQHIESNNYNKNNTTVHRGEIKVYDYEILTL